MPKQQQSVIGTAEEGSVELRGRVVAGGFILSPFSRREAVGLRIEFGSDWHWTSRTKKIIDVVEDFILDDGTGQALVVGMDAEIIVSVRRNRPFRVDQPSDELVHILDRAGVDIIELLGRSLLVAREYLLLPATSVVVKGDAHTEVIAQGIKGGYRTAPSLLTLRASHMAPLHVVPVD